MRLNVRQPINAQWRSLLHSAAQQSAVTRQQHKNLDRSSTRELPRQQIFMRPATPACQAVNRPKAYSALVFLAKNITVSPFPTKELSKIMEIDKSKPYPEINSLECKSCSRCVVACPKKVLQIGKVLNARGYYAVEYIGTGCIGCNTCFYTCPEPNALAIHVPEKN